MEIKNIKISDISPNTGQIEGVKKNPRVIRDTKFEKLKRSIEENPEMLALRELLVYPHEGKFVVIGGNMRLRACKDLGYKELPCKVIPTETPAETLNAYIVKDNNGFGEWDWDALATEWDSSLLDGWGVDLPKWGEEETQGKDFFNREDRNDDSRQEGNDEYNEFLDKFEQPKTTDDCYTPEPVYRAVVEWVERTYSVKRDKFVRPFYPGGDYQKFKYKKDSIVVDNPPFSILSEIIKFYMEKEIPFFLFAPALTLFSSSSSSCSCICVGIGIIYENKANVNTSFVTNLEPTNVRFRTAPDLYQDLKKAVDEFTKTIKADLPKYAYPDCVATSAGISYLSKYGQNFVVTREESQPIDELDEQKAQGKSIYGKGYLISTKASAEKASAIKWSLSDREKEIIATLDRRAEGREHHQGIATELQAMDGEERGANREGEEEGNFAVVSEG